MTMFNSFLKVGLLVLLAALVGLVILSGGLDEPVSTPLFVPQPVTIPRAQPRETAHSMHHKEAVNVQTRYDSHMCDNLLVFYSPTLGRLLFLCALPQIDLYGGLVYQITEDGGRILLGDDAHKVTVFIGNRHYWNGVVNGNGYKLFTAYITLQGLVKQRWPGLYW